MSGIVFGVGMTSPNHFCWSFASSPSVFNCVSCSLANPEPPVVLAEGHAEIGLDVGNAGQQLELARSVFHHHDQCRFRVDRRVDPAVDQILIRIGARLVHLDLGVAGLAFGLEPRLEGLDDPGGGAAEPDADGFAGQIVRRLDPVLAGAQHDHVARIGIWHRKQHLLSALFGDCHAGDDDVELTGVERRDDAVPGGVDKLCLDAELVDKIWMMSGS